MAKFDKSQIYNAFPNNHRICVHPVQLNVLMHILATQLCKLDDPQYGSVILSGIPTGEADEWITKATMPKGDFSLNGVSGSELAEQSISAAVNFPDIDMHYTQMASGSGLLESGAYFDERFGVLVLDANHGRLLVSMQLSYTEDGEEYAREHLLKAYGTAVMAIQYIMPKDEILQSSCVLTLNDIKQQYSNCMSCDAFLDDLNWVQGVFKRGNQELVQQLKHWQEEYPEIKSYFRA